MLASPADTCMRVAIQNAVARRADELLRGVDPSQRPQSPSEWVTRLTLSLGVVAGESDQEPASLVDALVELGADVQGWLEELGRESRAA